MKIVVHVLFYSLLVTFTYGQSGDIIKAKRDSLILIKKSYGKKMEEIDKEIFTLNQKLVAQNPAKLQIPLKVTRETYLYEGRGTYFPKLDTIPIETNLIGLDYAGFYYLVEYNKMRGWVMSTDLEDPDQEKIRLEQEEKIALRKKIALEKENDRRVRLLNKYGTEIGTKIYQRKIWLGMTDSMALDSWGSPEDINRSVGSWGVKEQWVYSSSYLYFENGKLTSWQD